MEVIINNHWTIDSTANIDGFKRSELEDMKKFTTMITNTPGEFTATITATKEYEHVDVMMELEGKKILWELKSYDNFKPDKPIREYWLKYDKAKWIKKVEQREKPDKIFYCMFAGTTDYCYYIDFEEIKEGLKTHTIDMGYRWNRKTTKGAKDEWRYELMILIPLQMMKKMKYR